MGGAATGRLLEHLDGVKRNGVGWTALCPAHPDRNPSLSVSEGDEGALIHCHAGCTTEAVLTAIDMQPVDLFNTPAAGTERQPAKRLKPRVVARYPYTDEDGHLLYEVERMRPKGFRQRRPNGNGGHVYRLEDVRRVLYRLPEVIAAVSAGEPVYVVEGEKDADALVAVGVCATCSPAGAGKFDKVPDAATVLAGARVVVVADKDRQGHVHARQVRSILQNVAESIDVVEAATGKDAADHLGAGHTVSEFVPVNLEDDDLATDDVDDNEGGPHSSFLPVDLEPWLTGEPVVVMPEILTMSDGRSLLYVDRLNEIHGDSGSGKSWVMAYDIWQRIRAGGGATLVVDLEDNPGPLIGRLRQLGVTIDQLREHVVFAHPDDSFLDALNIGSLIDTIRDRGVVHTYIDSLGEAFGVDGLKENDDSDVAPWIRAVSRRIINETGSGVTHIDHITKSADNPLHPSGSKRKRAAVTGASWFLTAHKALDKLEGGELRFMCGKDRHGNYRRGETIARLIMLAGGDRMDLEPLNDEQVVDDSNEALQRILLNLLREHPDGMNTRAIRGSVGARNARVSDQLEVLRSEGQIRREDLPRGEQEWHYVKVPGNQSREPVNQPTGPRDPEPVDNALTCGDTPESVNGSHRFPPVPENGNPSGSTGPGPVRAGRDPVDPADCDLSHDEASRPVIRRRYGKGAPT